MNPTLPDCPLLALGQPQGAHIAHVITHCLGRVRVDACGLVCIEWRELPPGLSPITRQAIACNRALVEHLARVDEAELRLYLQREDELGEMPHVQSALCARGIHFITGGWKWHPNPN